MIIYCVHANISRRTGRYKIQRFSSCKDKRGSSPCITIEGPVYYTVPGPRRPSTL